MYAINRNLPVTLKLTRDGINWAQSKGLAIKNENIIEVSLLELFLLDGKNNYFSGEIYVEDDNLNRFSFHGMQDTYDLIKESGHIEDFELAHKVNERINDLQIQFLENIIKAQFEQLSKLKSERETFKNEHNSKKLL